MKHPPIPGAMGAPVLRLATGPVAMPKAHENDFGPDAIHASRNAEMVREMQREKDIIAAHEGMRRMALQIRENEERARNAQQLAAMQQQAMQAQQARQHWQPFRRYADLPANPLLPAPEKIGSYEGVDIVADPPPPRAQLNAPTWYDNAVPGGIAELIRNQSKVGGWLRPEAEREANMMAHAKKMANDLRRPLTLEEVNKLRELYRLEPWPHEPDNRTGYFIPGSAPDDGSYRLD